VFKTFFHC